MDIGGLKKTLHLWGAFVCAGEIAVGIVCVIDKLTETGKGRDSLEEGENF